MKCIVANSDEQVENEEIVTLSAKEVYAASVGRPYVFTNPDKVILQYQNENWKC